MIDFRPDLLSTATRLDLGETVDLHELLLGSIKTEDHKAGGHISAIIEVHGSCGPLVVDILAPSEGGHQPIALDGISPVSLPMRHTVGISFRPAKVYLGRG